MSDNAAAAVDALVRAGTELLVYVPDSLLAPLYRAAARRDDLELIQANDEATAVGIASGASLGGMRTVAAMESSGIRRGCESLARLSLGHGMHCLVLIADRGGFGEPNWWGINQQWTLAPMLRTLRIPHVTLAEAGADLGETIADAYAMLDTRQTSAGIVASRSYCRWLAA